MRFKLIIALTLVISTSSAQQPVRPVDLVNPLLGTAHSRWFFFSSACRPFGMVNLSPDTEIAGTWNSGYRYNSNYVYFFSHIHCWQLSGIPVLPVSGEFTGHLGPEQYKSKFSHDQEIVTPGYHSVFLEKYNIKAELTSTTRVGLHRYTFPKGHKKHILIDLSTQLGPGGTEKGYVKMVNNMEIEGYALMEATRRRPKSTFVYFVAKFDTPFNEMRAWKDHEIIGEVQKFEDRNGGIFISFDGQKEQVIRMKVGISYVSIEQARLNIGEELNHWDFDRIVDESQNEWNSYLSRIEVTGKSMSDIERFYTDLWHSLQGRRIISDVNGKYCDMTGEKPLIKQIPLNENGKPKYNHHNSDAFWGAQWTISTLWHLVYPEISDEFVSSMLMMYKDGGLIPRGPSGGDYTYVMTGASSTPFIVSAYMKGIRNYDVETAYEGLKKNHLPGGIMEKAGYEHYTSLGGGLKYYITKGYVPYPLPEKGIDGFHQEGAGQTLEYAYQDWCLAQMAKTLVKRSDYQLFRRRADNYKNVYDKESGWMRPKMESGEWYKPYDIFSSKGFVEANAAQATWFVPHDLRGLAKLMGGYDSASLKLNHAFEIAGNYNFIPGPESEAYINYSNQPSMQTAFIFNYFGEPWLTQKWTRQVVEKIYSQNDPQYGYNGDEDQGLMGSLAVLMKIGLFDMRGGSAIDPEYEIGSPIFDKITIKLNQDYYEGDKFVIEAVNNSSNNRYIQSATLNNKNLNDAWFYHRELTKGGTLILEMGENPNKKWGINNPPPSMSNE